MVETVAQVIQTHGDAAAFARAIGVSPGVVRAWKHRGTIPRTAWPEIIETFPDLTLARLRDLETKQGEAAA